MDQFHPPYILFLLIEENYYGIYLLPGESRQVTANIEGYNGPVSYQWTSAECKIDNQLGKTCKITAPSKEGNPTIVDSGIYW